MYVRCILLVMIIFTRPSIDLLMISLLISIS